MEKDVVFLDTSILIDVFRKQNKANAVLYQLAQKYENFAVSVITLYEILTGSTAEQDAFWKSFFEKVSIYALDTETVEIASDIFKKLKIQSKLIEIPDIFIAATAIKHGAKLATINQKHFERIEDINLLQI